MALLIMRGEGGGREEYAKMGGGRVAKIEREEHSEKERMEKRRAGGREISRSTKRKWGKRVEKEGERKEMDKFSFRMRKEREKGEDVKRFAVPRERETVQIKFSNHHPRRCEDEVRGGGPLNRFECRRNVRGYSLVVGWLVG